MPIIIAKLLWSPDNRDGHNSFGLWKVRHIKELYHEVVSTVISVNIRKVSGLRFRWDVRDTMLELSPLRVTRTFIFVICSIFNAISTKFSCTFPTYIFFFKDIKRQYDEGASFCTILSNNKDVLHWSASLKSWTFHQFHCWLKRKISSVDLSNFRVKWKIVNQLDTYSIPFSFQKTYHVAK